MPHDQEPEEVSGHGRDDTEPSVDEATWIPPVIEDDELEVILDTVFRAVEIANGTIDARLANSSLPSQHLSKRLMLKAASLALAKGAIDYKILRDFAEQYAEQEAVRAANAKRQTARQTAKTEHFRRMYSEYPQVGDQVTVEIQGTRTGRMNITRPNLQESTEAQGTAYTQEEIDSMRQGPVCNGMVGDNGEVVTQGLVQQEGRLYSRSSDEGPWIYMGPARFVEIRPAGMAGVEGHLTEREREHGDNEASRGDAGSED